MEGIFSDEALSKCTLSGGEYRAGGKANIVRKPHLDQNAISVIIGKLWPTQCFFYRCFSHNFIYIILIFSPPFRCGHSPTKDERLETIS